MNYYIDYKFELDGIEYEAFNKYCGDTIEAIEELKADEVSNKQSAICDALDITIDEIEETDFLEKANFEYCEVHF